MESVSVESEQSQENDKIKTVSFHKLFTFADISDVALMIIGTIGALNNGVSMPLMAIIFGDLVDSFGKNQNNTDIVDVVSKLCWSQEQGNISTAIAGLVIAFIASWQLALIILALLPLIGVNGYVQMKFMKGFSSDAKMMYEEASQVANDAVGSIRTVASFCAEEKVMKLYQKKCEGLMKAGIRQGLISGAGFGLSFFLLYSVYATSFYAGA
ncbi:hypothetical protein EZV62_010199 [Acer yangbiense]|uniref:ABC transmembrane type-1 domain-containing protein n=1 Tax=Acer yangbiense TaxID=1000413 RepID=A0A5C7I2A6_9ROSI|nr:hypothetical protein EZV62_010199 [Acer yangbiense]